MERFLILYNINNFIIYIFTKFFKFMVNQEPSVFHDEHDSFCHYTMD